MKVWNENDNLKLEGIEIGSREYWIPIIAGYLTDIVCEYMRTNGFHRMNLPTLNESFVKKDCNIPVKYLENDYELSTSCALKLGGIVPLYDKVYSCTPSIRNEKRRDLSHLMEFTLIEAEWQIHDCNELLRFIEKMFIYVIEKYNDYISSNQLLDIFERCEFNGDIKKVEYSDVPDILRKKGITVKGEELGVFFDNALSQFIDEPVIVMHYPCKGSWRAKHRDDNSAYIYNLILPNGYGELFEFTVRETNPEYFKNKFKIAGLEKEYKWYISLLKKNNSLHGGFGLGIERFCSYLVKTNDIGETQLFERKPIVNDKEEK